MGLLFLGACSDDDNECRDLAEYDLTIQNKTAEAFDVHISPGPGNDFYHAGHVAARQMTIIHELDIGIDYLVHLTDVNAPAESAIHEYTISPSGEDVTWILAWEEVDLDLAPGGSQMLAIDFNGGQGLALGVQGTIGKDWAAENGFFRRQSDGSWLPDDPDNIPASILFLDLALDASGRPVLAGVQDVSPNSVLLDFRGSVPEYFTNTNRGLFAVDAGESFMVAGGWAMGGDLWTSTAPNV